MIYHLPFFPPLKAFFISKMLLAHPKKKESPRTGCRLLWNWIIFNRESLFCLNSRQVTLLVVKVTANYGWIAAFQWAPLDWVHTQPLRSMDASYSSEMMYGSSWWTNIADFVAELIANCGLSTLVLYSLLPHCPDWKWGIALPSCPFSQEMCNNAETNGTPQIMLWKT